MHLTYVLLQKTSSLPFLVPHQKRMGLAAEMMPAAGSSLNCLFQRTDVAGSQGHLSLQAWNEFVQPLADPSPKLSRRERSGGSACFNVTVIAADHPF